MNKDLVITQDWERTDGALVMKGAKTIELYKELKDGHPKEDGYFFAFSKQQFEENAKSIKLKDGEKIIQVKNVPGLFGTREGLDRMFDFYSNRDKRIREQCDPQEVYCYEWNNHECMFDGDGDEPAIKIIISTFGVTAARNVKRWRAYYSIDEIIKSK